MVWSYIVFTCVGKREIALKRGLEVGDNDVSVELILACEVYYLKGSSAAISSS